LPPTTDLTEEEIEAIEGMERGLYAVDLMYIDGEYQFVMDVPTGKRMVKVIRWLEYKAELQAWMEAGWSKTLGEKMDLEDKMYGYVYTVEQQRQLIEELTILTDQDRDELKKKNKIGFFPWLGRTLKKAVGYVATFIFGYGTGVTFPPR